MGNKQHSRYQMTKSNQSSSKQLKQQYVVSYHRHPNITQLIRTFRLFMNKPYNFIQGIQIIQSNDIGLCSESAILKIKSPFYNYDLEHLLNAKRKIKSFFVEKQIWYLIKSMVDMISFLQSEGILFGVFHPKLFKLFQGKFLVLYILHLLPNNEHQKSYSFHNYYSPEKISLFNKQPADPDQVHIDGFKSQIFSFGLLLLQIATCPAPKPKFHKPNLKQILWQQIQSRFNEVQQRYSHQLAEFLQFTLREDHRIRPDWSYLKFWIKRHEPVLDISPCVLWSI